MSHSLTIEFIVLYERIASISRLTKLQKIPKEHGCDGQTVMTHIFYYVCIPLLEGSHSVVMVKFLLLGSSTAEN